MIWGHRRSECVEGPTNSFPPSHGSKTLVSDIKHNNRRVCKRPKVCFLLVLHHQDRDSGALIPAALLTYTRLLEACGVTWVVPRADHLDLSIHRARYVQCQVTAL